MLQDPHQIFLAVFQHLTEVEDIVEALEAGELSLEEALARYEKGVANIKTCTALLKTAEKKIQVLLEKDGEFTVEDAEE